MIIDRALESSRLVLRCLNPGDIGIRYLAWLQDPEITRFLEVRHQRHTIESTVHFVEGVNQSTDSLILGIFLKATGNHIGNVKLGPVDRTHRHAHIGLLLGAKAEWGKGFAPEAIGTLVTYAFETLGMEKLHAGCYSENIRSQRAFLKAGFSIEGRLKRYWFANTQWQDQIVLGLAKHDHIAQEAQHKAMHYGRVDRFVLIGGGDLMLHAARQLAKAGRNVEVILAPRHAAEVLAVDGRQASIAFAESGVALVIVEDVNHWDPRPESGSVDVNALALCFGSAWIFPDRIRNLFGAGMINVNAIPIPRYLGGAHHTWQILNGDRSGGCFIQLITEAVDRGPVLRAHRFPLPDWVRLPKDYMVAIYAECCSFVELLIADLLADRAFVPTPFEEVNADRLYFPRLQTAVNGYIDWSWSTDEIERFCNAFDSPYFGAGTFLDGHEVRLSRVSRAKGSVETFHPFASGLIVRSIGGPIHVASRDGLLIIETLVAGDGTNLRALAREGLRFVTPPDILHRARAYRASYSES